MFGAKALVTVANAERMRTGDERMIAVLFVVCIRLVGEWIGDVKLLFCMFALVALFSRFFEFFTSPDMRTQGTNSDVLKYPCS